jgi:hypothetical protein
MSGMIGGARASSQTKNGRDIRITERRKRGSAGCSKVLCTQAERLVGGKPQKRLVLVSFVQFSKGKLNRSSLRHWLLI